jgi:predicted acyltransferase
LSRGGFSAILLGIFYYIIDVRKIDWWATPFVWIGTNAITIYMLVHIVELSDLGKRFAGGEIKSWFDATFRTGFGDFVIACVALLLAVLFCRFLYRRRIFLKV